MSDENFETQAREMGWVEKEQFRGDPTKWVDAKEFVERGEHFLPMLRANNKRLKDDLLTRDKEINTLKETVANVQKAMGVMQKHYDASVQQQVAQAKRDLAGQIKEAREAGDTDLEIQLLDQMSDLRETEKQAKKNAEEKKDEPEKVETKNATQLEFESWNRDNPWFGNANNAEDRKRTKALIRIGEDLREEGDTTVGRAFMEKCMEVLNEREGNTTTTKDRRPSSKVEGGNSGARGTAGRAFDKLPKEAKDACHADSDRFVGQGKMYKTVAEWEEAYATSYNEYED
jgi:hypothetical protein